MAPEYKVTTTDMPFNGKPKPNDLMLDEILRTNAQPITRRASMPDVPYFKVASVIVWFGAVYTTYLMIASLQPGTPLSIAIGVAIALQFVFTMAEKPIMHGRAGIFTYAVFLFDALINAGGLYPALANVGKTPTAQMLASAGTSPDVGSLAGVILSLAIGAVIAVAPESLWKQR